MDVQEKDGGCLLSREAEHDEENVDVCFMLSRLKNEAFSVM